MKGTSGNPSGRPKGSRRAPPYEAILGQNITIKENGESRELIAQEAFQLRLLELAPKGNYAAARAIEVLESEHLSVQSSAEVTQRQIIVHLVTPGSVNSALELLNMGTVLDRYREANARVVLEPWLVTAALERLGEGRLSRSEQEEVVQATRTPKKMAWPDWWEVLPV